MTSELSHYLIFNNQVFVPPFQLIFEPGVRHTQVNIGLGFNRRIAPEEYFPMVVHILQHGGESHIQHGQVFIGLCVPEHFHFLPFGTN
jgi:hypothetical protein